MNNKIIIKNTYSDDIYALVIKNEIDLYITSPILITVCDIFTMQITFRLRLNILSC